MRPTPAHLIACALVSLAASSCSSDRPPDASQPAPRKFSSQVDNPWFPLPRGTTFRYRGTKDGKPAYEVLTVTHRVKTITGAPCAVLRDRLFQSGRLVEDTTDWYSQDQRGNVWYFGERTATLDAKGRVESREGSFQAGVEGAGPGIFMPAHPKVGQSFQQESFRGHAEDHFKIKDLSARVRTPFVSSSHAMRTIEWTPLEPGVLDAKYYVRGLGTVREEQVKGPGPPERLRLVSVTRPAHR